MATSIKFQTFKGMILILERGDKEELQKFITEKTSISNAADWLKSQPIVLDLSKISDVSQVNYRVLQNIASLSSFNIIGVASSGNPDRDTEIKKIGANIIEVANSKNTTPKSEEVEPVKEEILETPKVEENTQEKENLENKPIADSTQNMASELVVQDSCETVIGNIRSGKQIYARSKSIVVIGNVGNGADISADDSVFIFGTMRGRIIAGRNGNKNSVIYCRNFQPQLVSIAGIYCTMDDIPECVLGRPVMVRLDGDKFDFKEQD